MGQRDVFAILLGAVVFAAMVVDVGVVDKRGDEEGDSAEQVPDQPEGVELSFANVHEFVNEERAAVVEERGDKKADNANWPVPGRVGGKQRRGFDERERGDAESPAGKKIGPVDPGIGSEELADDGTSLGERELGGSGCRFGHLVDSLSLDSGQREGSGGIDGCAVDAATLTLYVGRAFAGRLGFIGCVGGNKNDVIEFISLPRG